MSSDIADINLIKIGAVIKHVRTGGIYSVIGRCDKHSPFVLLDMCDAIFIVRDSIDGAQALLDLSVDPSLTMPILALPVRIQVSDPRGRPIRWIIYRSLMDGGCWARPADEFQNRFVQHYT
ncbi:hypothetical protein CC53_gp149 [Rhizobium phage vB_RleS_L338C]|uniref:hypothetical protein n=1 Tax=Rhizobium phage vB_RleS_L338C TaxID=1414737 RepID=UPI0003D8619A|nr:hypothetical protein CC53_gp149 [Rhizobium phage vB_RleS_L338C]AHC30566.1 hypothetical protein L338C_149 [Rhizobium phage vB_RleS_L338C]QNH72131.1 hypothetical protein P11VFA_002 [Rhizobium phage P11VFA]